MPTIYFEFVVSGPPLSVNTKKSQPEKHRKWQGKVAQAARQNWSQNERNTVALLMDAPVEVLIATYFTAQPLDVDNVIKPILDSLIGILYIDDNQVYKITSERIDLNNFNQAPPSKIIADALDVSNEFVHIALTWKDKEI